MPRTLVIDACCTLNLLATRREVDIAEALDLLLLDTPQVARQAQMLWTPPDADGNRGKEPASSAKLRKSRRLDTRRLDGQELTDAFVRAAEQIDDADASCIALAGVLELPLFTDDRKARRIAQSMFSEIELVSTLDVLAEAAKKLKWSADELSKVALDLYWRGSFAPPRNDPRREWYAKLVASR